MSTVRDEIARQDAEVLARHQMLTYARPPILFDKGRGSWLWDRDDKRYLDFTSGIAVNALGHCDPEIVRAITDQASRLGHVSNLFHTEAASVLAGELCAASFADRVFFANSGAEAVEAAVKIARKHARTVHGPGKQEIVAFRGSFHGRTAGALSLTDREAYQAPFRPLLPGVTFAPFDDLETAGAIIGPRTSAVIVEPVQGEGGVRVASPAFLRGLRQICDRHGALLIFDEVQSGLGRSGRLWAYQHSDVEPDLMTLAKALGGGLPIGAVLAAAKVAEVLQPGDHATTFGGGPVPCRAASVVLGRVNAPAFLSHVDAMGHLLRQRLSEIDGAGIREVRGLGLMLGVELDRDVQPLIGHARDRGLLVLSAGPRVLRLLPPLNVLADEVERAVEVLAEVLRMGSGSC